MLKRLILNNERRRKGQLPPPIFKRKAANNSFVPTPAPATTVSVARGKGIRHELVDDLVASMVTARRGLRRTRDPIDGVALLARAGANGVPLNPAELVAVLSKLSAAKAEESANHKWAGGRFLRFLRDAKQPSGEANVEVVKAFILSYCLEGHSAASVPGLLSGLRGYAAAHPMEIPWNLSMSDTASLRTTANLLRECFPPQEDGVTHQCTMEELRRLHNATHDGTPEGLYAWAFATVAVAICGRGTDLRGIQLRDVTFHGHGMLFSMYLGKGNKRTLKPRFSAGPHYPEEWGFLCPTRAVREMLAAVSDFDESWCSHAVRGRYPLFGRLVKTNGRVHMTASEHPSPMKTLKPFFIKAGIPDIKINFGRTTGSHAWRVEMHVPRELGRENGRWAPADTMAKFYEHRSPLSLLQLLRPALLVGERIRRDLLAAEGKAHPVGPVVFCCRN